MECDNNNSFIYAVMNRRIRGDFSLKQFKQSFYIMFNDQKISIGEDEDEDKLN